MAVGIKEELPKQDEKSAGRVGALKSKAHDNHKKLIDELCAKHQY